MSCVARGCSGGISFATCSADGTIRLWDVALQPNLGKNDTDNDSLHGKQVGSTRLVSAGIFERDIVESDVCILGFRSIAASSDGKYLAAGDCEGNLHIYNLLTFDNSCFPNVHDTEILSLSFSSSANNDMNSEKVNGNYFLASGGRDRIIHLYDAKRNFDLIESIDDHSAAVTSVKLTNHGHKILSCSADRSLVFRDVSVIDGGCKILCRHHQMASHGTVYDMALDPAMEFVVTVGQDKTLNTFDIASGKLTRMFKQDKNSGEPIKVTMDPSCSYLACCYSNKSMCVYDSSNGEMVTQAMGHGEVITGIIFLPDCEHVVSVGGDGCIFVWKLPARISSKILERVKENFVPLSPEDVGLPIPFNQLMFCEEEDQQQTINPKDVFFVENCNQAGEKILYQGGRSQRFSTFRFSISRLPRWAQDKVETSSIVPTLPDFSSSKLSLQSHPPQQMDLRGVSTMDGGGRGSPLCLGPQTSTTFDAEESKSCYSSISRSSSDTNNNQSSPMSQETLNFALDKHWVNVYTVCPNLFHSAEPQHLTDPKMPVLSFSLPKGDLSNPFDFFDEVFIELA